MGLDAASQAIISFDISLGRAVISGHVEISLRFAKLHPVSPDNAPLMMLYAQACLEEFAFDEGRAHLRKPRRWHLRIPNAKLGVSRALHLMGRTSEAIVRGEALAQESPRFCHQCGCCWRGWH
jgi:hypothetical protein